MVVGSSQPLPFAADLPRYLTVIPCLIDVPNLGASLPTEVLFLFPQHEHSGLEHHSAIHSRLQRIGAHRPTFGFRNIFGNFDAASAQLLLARGELALHLHTGCMTYHNSRP